MRIAMLSVAVVLVLLANGAFAQDASSADEEAGASDAAASAPAADPAAEPEASPADAPPAEAVHDELLEQLEESPLIEPTQRPGDGERAGGSRRADPRVLGPAPALAGSSPRAGTQPELRRDGEFVISRRGRLVPSPEGSQMLFAFDADSAASPEPPMILLPCQMLQNMEDLLTERGDQLVFIVSGQVYAYRGANYLLPTMMTIAFDRGNLQP